MNKVKKSNQVGLVSCLIAKEAIFPDNLWAEN